MARPRTHTVLLSVIAVAVTVGGAAAWWHYREPVYLGRSATEWLAEAELQNNPRRSWDEVCSAFKAMGREAAPVLARHLEAKPSWLQSRLWELKYSRRLPQWLARRIPPYRDYRRISAELLFELGPDAEPALPVLVRIFREEDRDEVVQDMVNSTLRQLGGKLGFLVPELVAGLKDNRTHVQALCLSLLAAIGPEARAAIPDLDAMVAQRGPLTRHAALALLKIDGRTNLAVEVLARSLSSSKSVVRQMALYDLRKLGPAARGAAPEVQRALRDSDELVRRDAAATLEAIDAHLLRQSLNEINQELATQVERLIATIEVGNYGETFRAIEALTVIGPSARTAVPTLRAILAQMTDMPFRRDSEGRALVELNHLHKAAIEALGAIGPDAAAAVPRLVQHARAEDAPKAIDACRALGQVGPGASNAVPVLQELLSNSNPHLQVAAALSLVRLDPGSTPMVHRAVSGLTNSPEARLRLPAIVALWEPERRDPSPVETLLAAFEDRTENAVQSEIHRIYVAQLLGDIGPQAKVAVPALTDFLHQADQTGKRTAAIAIQHIDPEAYAALGLPGILSLP